ncbi:hypothetical protein EJ08DRAFT_130344 [Tothia fuscella]|uniref:Uncharacterized protein n=1 Tax=Tothia fuscella TaxID=1048955 RepID=A0A9P4NU94_9PEZI|nr:hypothetical protein EJ08DRAFT_130344 [Tothia fuscella]
MICAFCQSIFKGPFVKALCDEYELDRVIMLSAQGNHQLTLSDLESSSRDGCYICHALLVTPGRKRAAPLNCRLVFNFDWHLIPQNSPSSIGSGRGALRFSSAGSTPDADRTTLELIEADQTGQYILSTVSEQYWLIVAWKMIDPMQCPSRRYPTGPELVVNRTLAATLLL